MKKAILTQFSRPLLFAHRGLSSVAPENTLAAFSAAKDAGIPGIELDVHLCKSGELVVIHDSSLKRTAKGNPDLEVENLTLAELKTYDLGGNFKTPDGGKHNFGKQTIMTLEEVLDFTGPELYLDVELKTESVKCQPIAKRTAEILNAYVEKEAGDKNQGRFIVSSFNPMALRFFKKHSSIPTAIIYANDSGVPWYLRHGEGRFISGADILKPCWKDIIKVNRKKLPHWRHYKSYVWTVDDLETAKKLVKVGAEAIISNKAQEIKAVLQ